MQTLNISLNGCVVVFTNKNKVIVPKLKVLQRQQVILVDISSKNESVVTTPELVHVNLDLKRSAHKY